MSAPNTCIGCKRKTSSIASNTPHIVYCCKVHDALGQAEVARQIHELEVKWKTAGALEEAARSRNALAIMCTELTTLQSAHADLKERHELLRPQVVSLTAEMVDMQRKYISLLESSIQAYKQ
jgi:hypothetical protein